MAIMRVVVSFSNNKSVAIDLNGTLRHCSDRVGETVDYELQWQPEGTTVVQVETTWEPTK